MKLINRENGEELVEVGSHKDYASKGVAGAGLGLGIAGTALWLLSGGFGGGLFGNRFGAAGAAAYGQTARFKAIALDKDDINEFKEMLSKIQQ
jgi:hypothetical protein